jgi:hypothetical protein
METTIIFGSKRLGQQLAAASSGDKYPDRAVVTVEGNKGARKSRRLLFNTKAAQKLGLDNGEIQELVFASVEGVHRQVLVANKSLVPSADQDNIVSYKTSKNRVANGEETKEKSKAITSSFFCKEVYSFLGLEEDNEASEFYLNTYPANEIEAYALVPVGQEVVIETNLGSHTMADVQDSVTTEIAKQEAADSILNEDAAVKAAEEYSAALHNAEVEAIKVMEEEVVVPQVEEAAGNDWDLDEEAEVQAVADIQEEGDSDWD